MLKKLFLPIILTALMAATAACNKDKDDEYEYIESSAVSVTAFSLQNNSKVLDSLSNVFFSIDLVNAKIFNADSLPYGTRINRLIPKITYSTGARAVELSYYDTKAKKDSTVNYLTNSTDSIDFSNGPVKLTITSQSGAVKRTYEIKVNVHQVKADTLAWYSIQSAPLPTTMAKPSAQYTVQLKGTYYCLTTDGTSYCLATTTNPADPQWATEEITMPFEPKVESLRASDSALYILDMDGAMYTSTDCKTWTATGQTWHYIYGGYVDDVIGSVKADGKYAIASYPTGKTWTMPDNFPVEGTSLPTTYTLQMGYAPQYVMVGGRTANGTLTAYAWGFDGEEWAEISTQPLKYPMEYVTLVPYSMLDVPSTTWTPESYPALVAMGGRLDNGSINRDLYYSRDFGMTWKKAPSTMQLPDAIPTSYGAPAYEYTTTMHVGSRAALWTEIPVMALPAHCIMLQPGAKSRAIAPLTQWECPAIYLFGGRDYDGNVLNMVWRGVITQYTFVPVE